MVEGGFVMVILGLLFYIFRTNRIAQIIVLAIISVIAHLFDPTTVQSDDDLRCDSYVFLQW